MVRLKCLLFFIFLMPIASTHAASEKEDATHLEHQEKELLNPLIKYSRSKEWKKSEDLLWNYISDKSIPCNFRFSASMILVKIYFNQKKYIEATVLGEELLCVDSLQSMGAINFDMTIISRNLVRNLESYKFVVESYRKLGEDRLAERFSIKVNNILRREKDEASLIQWDRLLYPQKDEIPDKNIPFPFKKDE